MRRATTLKFEAVLLATFGCGTATRVEPDAGSADADHETNDGNDADADEHPDVVDAEPDDADREETNPLDADVVDADGTELGGVELGGVVQGFCCNRPFALVVADDGDAIVAGQYECDTSFGPGGVEVEAEDSWEPFVARWSPDGRLRWVQAAVGPGLDIARGVALLDGGLVATTGWFSRELTFDPGGPNETTIEASGTPAAFVAVYDGEGALIRVEAIENAAGVCVAAAPGGYVLTGTFNGETTFGQGRRLSVETNLEKVTVGP